MEQMPIFDDIRHRLAFSPNRNKSEDVQKTAFMVENEHFQFVRMPFGLKNTAIYFSESDG